MTTEQWDFDRYDRDLMLYKGDFVKTLTSKREICDYLNALEADHNALQVAVEALEKVKSSYDWLSKTDLIADIDAALQSIKEQGR